MHIWPFLIIFVPMMLAIVVRLTASGLTITGHLPPSSSVTGTRLAAAALATSRPTVGFPV